MDSAALFHLLDNGISTPRELRRCLACVSLVLTASRSVHIPCMHFVVRKRTIFVSQSEAHNAKG